MNWLTRRLLEPSSYGGLGMAIGGVTEMMQTGNTSSAMIALILGGLAAFVKGEGAR